MFSATSWNLCNLVKKIEKKSEKNQYFSYVNVLSGLAALWEYTTFHLSLLVSILLVHHFPAERFNWVEVEHIQFHSFVHSQATTHPSTILKSLWRVWALITKTHSAPLSHLCWHFGNKPGFCHLFTYILVCIQVIEHDMVGLWSSNFC